MVREMSIFFIRTRNDWLIFRELFGESGQGELQVHANLLQDLLQKVNMIPKAWCCRPKSRHGITLGQDR